MKLDYVVVGAGLFGATIARLLTDLGSRCLVVEQRNHVGGNCATSNREGVVVHEYGPHIFHTNDRGIWDFVRSYADFTPFVNTPKAVTSRGCFSLPFNMHTFEEFWGITDPAEAERKIKSDQGYTNPSNAEEKAISMVGRELYEEFIKGYTTKQWGRDPKDLPTQIVGRLPVRFTYDNNYYDHKYQGIPTRGYSELIGTLLSGIEVLLNTDFLLQREYFTNQAKHIVYTGALDALFDHELGSLAYRSIEFELERVPQAQFQTQAVTNYCSLSVAHTRVTEHKHFNGSSGDATYITTETPEEYDGNNVPCYPINDRQNNERYRQYTKLVKHFPTISFGGRLAQYRYLDMDMIIASAFAKSRKLHARFSEN